MLEKFYILCSRQGVDMKIWSHLTLFLNTHSQEPFISKLAQRKSLKEENLTQYVSLNLQVYKSKHTMNFLTGIMFI